MMRLGVSASSAQCLCCGSHVTPQFRRGFGDEEDQAHRCSDCDTYERLTEGSAAGKDVDVPDPLEDPSRFGGAVEELPENVKGACQQVAVDGGDQP